MIPIPEEILLDPKNKLEIIIKDTELKVDNVYAIAIWNAALEEATKICDKYESYGAAYEIRTMRK